MVRKFVEPEKLKGKASIVPATVSKSDPYHQLYDMSLTVSESDRINKPYLVAVASAMYASCITRGDCAFYTSFLSQFSKLPFPAAWDALEQLLLSMYATRKHALTYDGKEIKIPDSPTCSPPLNPSVIKKMFGLIVYSDASWKLNCTYAGFFILFCNGAIDCLGIYQAKGDAQQHRRRSCCRLQRYAPRGLRAPPPRRVLPSA